MPLKARAISGELTSSLCRLVLRLSMSRYSGAIWSASRYGRRAMLLLSLFGESSGDHSAIERFVFAFVVGVGILDAGEIEQHSGHRLFVGREHRGAHPHALGPAAAAECDDLAFGDVVLAGEQRPAREANLLIRE